MSTSLQGKLESKQENGGRKENKRVDRKKKYVARSKDTVKCNFTERHGRGLTSLEE